MSYTPKETLAKFIVSSPGELDQRIDSVETEVGMMISERYFHVLEGNPSFTFMITMVQYPPGTVPSDSTEVHEELLSDVIYNSADQLLGSVIYDTDISTDDIMARMYRLSYGADSMSIKSRVMFYEGQLYNVQVACPTSSNLDKKVDKFLDSFMILKEED